MFSVLRKNLAEWRKLRIEKSKLEKSVEECRQTEISKERKVMKSEHQNQSVFQTDILPDEITCL